VDKEYLDQATDSIRVEFERVNKARDQAYQRSRKLISMSAKAIRAVHRNDWDLSNEIIAEAKEAAEALVAGVESYPFLLPLPTRDDLAVEGNTWLNGLAEAATELRRRILDIIRHGHSDESERLLDAMDEIYSLLVTFDFNDSITGGLRRRTDTVRAVLERTRGDMTTSFRQAELAEALKALESKIGEDPERS